MRKKISSGLALIFSVLWAINLLVQLLLPRMALAQNIHGQVIAAPDDPALSPVRIRASSGQTADLLQVYNAAGTKVTFFDNAGNANLNGLTLPNLTANAFIYSGAGGVLTTTAAPTNGQLLIGSTGVAPVLASLTGTVNRVTVTGGAGTITLSGPQDLGTASSPTFGGMTVGTPSITLTNLGLSLGAGQGITFASGTGQFTQNFASSTSATAMPVAVVDTQAGGATTTVYGLGLSLQGNANSGSNTITGINFPAVTTIANNTFNGITFSTGFNNFLTSATINITAAGAITGVTSLTASTGITSSNLTANAFLYSGTGGLLTATAAPTNGQLLVGSTGVAPVVAALTGTANRVTVTNGAGTITLSGPQDLAAASTPTFSTLTLSGLTANAFLYSGTAGLLTSTAAPTNGQLLIGSTGVAPVLASLTGTVNRVTVTGGAGTITLSGPQDLATVSNVTFNNITGNGNLLGNTITAVGSASVNGQSFTIDSLSELTTIAAAATTDTVIQIPVNAVVFAVSTRVTTAIPTAATFTVTGTSSATTFSTAAVSTALNSTDVGTGSCPYKNGAAQTIRFTPNVAPATNAGRVRVTIHFYTVTTPTS